MRSALLVASLLVLGCAHQPPKDKTVCAEYQDLKCLAAPVCTMDEARGCRVCQCAGAGGYDPSRPESYQGQPDRPTTQPKVR